MRSMSIEPDIMLGERRQAFLGGGGARRAARQRCQHRLLAAVERGQRVHEELVHQQLVAVVLAEAGVGAQADARRAGGGLGDQVRVELDADLPCAMNSSGRSAAAARCTCRPEHVVGSYGAQQLAVELVGQVDEVARGLAGWSGRRPAARSPGRPNRRIECVGDAGVPIASSSSVAIASSRRCGPGSGRADGSGRARRRSHRARARAAAVLAQILDHRQHDASPRARRQELRTATSTGQLTASAAGSGAPRATRRWSSSACLSMSADTPASAIALGASSRVTARTCPFDARVARAAVVRDAAGAPRRGAAPGGGHRGGVATSSRSLQ